MALDAAGERRLAALRVWRTEVAAEHNVPAYVVFGNAALEEMAHLHPVSLVELAQVNGVGVKKLEAYGRDILRVLDSA